ncbi:hypothetical protein [Ruegeria sp. HKCCE4150]|uniref:hypothetical protein n=1 Tax=Ruegeria sp. HKCCE4150 TaxID=2794828 RepID=UPI0032AF41C3
MQLAKDTRVNLESAMKVRQLVIPILFACSGTALTEELKMDQSDLSTLDKDGDGAVSKSEYDAFSNYAFDIIDTDNNGELSADEVDDYLAGDAFEILDDDGNGTVSPSEFSTQMSEDFVSGDKDGDGILN